MSKKLWTVTKTVEFVVVAESAPEAAEKTEGMYSLPPEDQTTVVQVREFDGWPYGWFGEDLPFGEFTATPISELIEQGYAPKYTRERNARLEAAIGVNEEIKEH